MLHQQFSLQTAAQQSVQFVKMGAAVNHDPQDTSAETLQSRVRRQIRWHQILPQRNDRLELLVGFFDGLFELLSQELKAQVLSATASPLSQPFNVCDAGVH